MGPLGPPGDVGPWKKFRVYPLVCGPGFYCGCCYSLETVKPKLIDLICGPYNCYIVAVVVVVFVVVIIVVIFVVVISLLLSLFFCISNKGYFNGKS